MYLYPRGAGESDGPSMTFPAHLLPGELPPVVPLSTGQFPSRRSDPVGPRSPYRSQWGWSPRPIAARAWCDTDDPEVACALAAAGLDQLGSDGDSASSSHSRTSSISECPTLGVVRNWTPVLSCFDRYRPSRDHRHAWDALDFTDDDDDDAERNGAAVVAGQLRPSGRSTGASTPPLAPPPPSPSRQHLEQSDVTATVPSTQPSPQHVPCIKTLPVEQPHPVKMPPPPPLDSGCPADKVQPSGDAFHTPCARLSPVIRSPDASTSPAQVIQRDPTPIRPLPATVPPSTGAMAAAQGRLPAPEPKDLVQLIQASGIKIQPVMPPTGDPFPRSGHPCLPPSKSTPIGESLRRALHEAQRSKRR